MNTVINKTDNLNIDKSVIQKAASILQQGGLVAFPTETVYGLGGNGLSEIACKKIYEAKGRPSDNPLILHIGSLKQLDSIVCDVTPMAKKVMDAFWPGPMTLIFKKKSCVPDSVTGGLDTVGVRFPSDKIACELINLSELPIAAPSANSSGKPSPTTAEHVIEDLYGKIDMIIDGGNTQFGLESTIIDVTGDTAVILRPGAVTFEMLEQLLGHAEIDPAVMGRSDGDIVPRAPGMKYKHYSPKAEVIMVSGEREKVVEKINGLISLNTGNGLKTGVLSTDETKSFYDCEVVLSLGKREDETELGSNLFKALREFDELKVDVVYSEVFKETGKGLAIMNRLKKAAGYNLIEV